MGRCNGWAYWRRILGAGMGEKCEDSEADIWVFRGIVLSPTARRITSCIITRRRRA